MAKKNKLAISDREIAKKALSNIKTELISERVEMVRDYVKGAYRMRHETEETIKNLQTLIDNIDEAIEGAEDGDLDLLKKLDIPARYLSEKTVRLNDLDWRG